MRLPRGVRIGLRHADRRRVENMLRERPQLEREDEERDLGLWLRLFEPDDLVRIGEVTSEASAASPGELCWGCTWQQNGVPKSAVAHCVSARELLRGVSHAESMTRREACEAVIGRMPAGNVPILLVVDDGEEGLEVWIDTVVSDFPRLVSRGRSPGGHNARTGRMHRVVWAYEGLWEKWREEDCCPTEGRPEPDRLDADVDRVIGWGKARNGRKGAW